MEVLGVGGWGPVPKVQVLLSSGLFYTDSNRHVMTSEVLCSPNILVLYNIRAPLPSSATGLSL